MARNTVSRYELGHQAPSGRALLRLVAIYGKPMEWFYDEEEEPQAHAEHLDRYVGEFEGRHNSRPLDTADQVAAMARNAEGKRLRYDDLIAGVV